MCSVSCSVFSQIIVELLGKLHPGGAPLLFTLKALVGALDTILVSSSWWDSGSPSSALVLDNVSSLFILELVF